MNLISTVELEGKKVTFTWIPTDSIDSYSPISQAYGICLNNQNEVLICHEPGREHWGLPGGGLELGETAAEALRREFMEEVDTEIDNIQPLGVQKVEESGKTYYQSRFFCRAKNLLPQTLDPDTGLIYERKFIPLADLNNYLKWGRIGDAIIALAFDVLRQEAVM